jgi:hypothetical protein
MAARPASPSPVSATDEPAARPALISSSSETTSIREIPVSATLALLERAVDAEILRLQTVLQSVRDAEAAFYWEVQVMTTTALFCFPVLLPYFLRAAGRNNAGQDSDGGG